MEISIQGDTPKNNIIQVSSPANLKNEIFAVGSSSVTNKIAVTPIYGISGESSFYIICDNLSERDAIPADKRGVGLFSYVISDDNIYQLRGGVANKDWVLLTKSYASVGMFNSPENPLDGTFYFNLSESNLYIFHSEKWHKIPTYEEMSVIIEEHNISTNAHANLFAHATNNWKSI